MYEISDFQMCGNCQVR